MTGMVTLRSCLMKEEYEEAFEIREHSDEDEGENRIENEVEAEGQEEDLVIGRKASRNNKVKILPLLILSMASVKYRNIFGSKSNARDAENQLMGLFEYQSFYAATAKFLKNRDATKLMRCDAEERINVEVAMRVDLESMAFSQGGHLMSNRKCKPPDAAPSSARRRVTGKFMFPRAEGDLVPLVSLLAWAREAFIVPKLNRAQSKLYPIAFGTDEPILLCVPTGAGKEGRNVLVIGQCCRETNESDTLTLLLHPRDSPGDGAFQHRTTFVVQRVDLVDDDKADEVGGRPQYGEGIIITNDSELQYARMPRSPALYGGADCQESDLGLVQKRADIAHPAVVLLKKSQRIKYERSTSRFTSMELGKITSYYYVEIGAVQGVRAVERVQVATCLLILSLAICRPNPSCNVRNMFEAWMGCSYEGRRRHVQDGGEEDVECHGQFKGVPPEVVRNAEGKEF
ncbi:hypothetical protein BDZ97DRAFT_1770784, partial [Flammula alnicola]